VRSLTARRGLVGLGVFVLVLSGGLVLSELGGDPVPVPRSELTAVEQASCREFIRTLPDKLAGRDPRETSPPDGFAAAWGDPAIVVSCGGNMPSEYDSAAACEEIAGIGWFVPADQLTDLSVDAQVTTIGIEPIVSVRLPATSRADAAGVLTEIAPALKARLTATAPCV
jgi:Protein of unknown function (DUF3515)